MEMKLWQDKAEMFPFIAITVNLESSRNSLFLEDDRDYLSDVFQRLTSSLQYDQDWVIYTAHSGGGYAGWEIIAKHHDDLFTGLCFTSANGNVGRVVLSQKWKDRPIYLLWSDNDAPITSQQNPPLADFLRYDFQASRLKTDIISGGGHARHPEKFIAWLRQEISQSGKKH